MKAFTLLLSVSFLFGCGVDGDNDPLSDHCAYRNSNSGSRYCETTFIEIVASPSLFDSRNVTFRGWLVRVGEEVIFHPFPEYVDRGFSGASIIVETNDAPEELRRELLSLEDGAWKMTLTGRFEVLRGKQPDTEVPRLGRLNSLQSMHP